MAEENTIPNQLNTTDNTQQAQQAPVYNPFLGLTYKQFNQILAGDNPDAPLIETDLYGNIKLHPENVGKSGPARISVNKYGQKTVQRTQEQLLKDFQEEQKAAEEMYSAIAPKIAQNYSKNAFPVQLAYGLGVTLPDKAGQAFASTGINIYHGILAQKRNYAEAEWKSYLSLIDNADGSVQTAQQIVKQFEDNGLNFQYADVSKIQANNKVKDILYNYKNLLKKRHEDEKNMRLAVLFNEEEGTTSKLIQEQNLVPIPDALKELKGNKNSITGMLSEIGGDVAGSLAFYYTFGLLTGGAAAGAGRLIGAGTKAGQFMLANSAALGEYAVFTPSFLNQYNSIRSQALMEGLDIDTANAAGFWAGLAEGGLELLGFRGFNRLYTRGGYLYNAILKGVIPESLQEGAQTFSEDLITNRFGITEKDFGEIMTDCAIAMLGGAIGGGSMMGGRYRLEGWTAAGLKIVDDFHRTMKKHTQADVSAGVAVARERIQAENAAEAPLKEPVKPINPPTEPPAGGAPTGGNTPAGEQSISEPSAAAETQGPTEKGSEKSDTEQNNSKDSADNVILTTGEDWKDIQDWDDYNRKTGRTDGQNNAASQEQQSAEVNQSEQTEEGTNEVADAVYDMYNELKRIATEKARARYGKKIKDAQIKNLWNAVSEQVFLQATDGAIADAFNGQIDKALAVLDSNNKLIKQNAENVKKALLESNMFTPELAEKLTSEDWVERHDAQWTVAYQEIINMFERNGASRAEGEVAAKWIKGMFYQMTFLNPEVSPSDIIAGMQENVINTQRAILNGQELPDLFATQYTSIGEKSFANPKQAREFAEKVVATLTQKKKDKTALAYLKEELFGNQKMGKIDFDALLATLRSQGELQRIIFSNMLVSNKQQLSVEDYMAIALLQQMGERVSNIATAFGFTFNGDPSVSSINKNYQEVLKNMFPVLSYDEMRALSYLDEAISTEDKNKVRTAEGFFVTRKRSYAGDITEQAVVNPGTAVIQENKPGVMLHEVGGHATMSAFVEDGLLLRKFGLLKSSSHTNSVSNILNHLAKKMKQKGTRVTEEQLQETTMDALAQMIEKGQVEGDPELTALFTKLKEEEHFVATKRLSGSLLSKATKGKSKSGALSDKQKEGINETILNVLQNKNAANQISNARELERIANFEIDMGENVNKETAKESGQKRLDTIRKKLLDFMDNNIIPDEAAARYTIEKAYAAKDLLFLSGFASHLATQAKTVAFMSVLQEVTNTSDSFYDPKSVDFTSGEERPGMMFMAEESKGVKLNKRKEYNPNYKANFREQPKGLLESAKESFSFLDIWEGGKDVMSRYLQSLESSAPTNMARHLLMTQFYIFGKRSQRASELLAKVVKPLDQKMKEAQAKSEKEYDDLRRRFQNNFFAVLADGKEGAYKQSAIFIRQELGEEAGNAWWQICGLLRELSGTKNRPGLLEQAGISQELLKKEGDYFPLQVAEFEALVKDYFHHATVYNEIEKLKNRIRKAYEDTYGGKIPEDKKAEVEVEISNKVNALFQRYQSDEHALSSFQHKTLFDFSSDPSILNYYADPFDTVSKYLDAAYRTIMMRNLVGKVTYDEAGRPNLDFKGAPGALGRYLANLPIGEVGNKAINNFKEKLAYLAQRDSGSGSLLDSIRKINQITTLGSVFNAINQCMDLSFAASIFGAGNVASAVKEVLSGEGLKISDVYTQSSNEVFRMQGEGVLSRIGKAVFKYSGFEYADIKVKEVILNASTKFFQQGLNAKENSRQYKDAMYYIDQCWPEGSEIRFSEEINEKEQEKEKKIFNSQRDMVIESLKKGEDNDYTRYVKWFMLTKTQPINAATVPAIYNAMGPFGKMCYQFSTVAIRQLEFLTDRIQMRYKTEGALGAAREYMKLVLFLAMLGLPKEIIENMMKGRKTDIAKTVALTPFHIFMINEYTIAVAQRDGLASAAATITAPSFGLLNNVSKDLFRAVTFKSYKGNTWKSVPLFGWAAYWWMFGGREQNLKNKMALIDFSPEEKKTADDRATSDLKYMETGED